MSALSAIFQRHRPILGRAACVGQEILHLKFPGRVNTINQQKARIDLLLEFVNGGQLPKARLVEEYMARKDVFPLIVQQEKLDWLKHVNKVRFVMMDSFSELTDQKFTHKEDGWSFYCHYTDLHHTQEFERQFDSNGLLEIEKFEEVYWEFFSWLEATMKFDYVVFVHYSAKFDSRTIYGERVQEIRRVLANLSSSKPYIYNLCVDDSHYFPHEKDSFPYHYSKETYHHLLDKWNRIDLARRSKAW